MGFIGRSKGVTKARQGVRDTRMHLTIGQVRSEHGLTTETKWSGESPLCYLAGIVVIGTPKTCFIVCTSRNNSGPQGKRGSAEEWKVMHAVSLVE